MKKALCIILVLILGLSLVACGGKTAPSASPSPSPSESAPASSEPSTEPTDSAAPTTDEAPAINLENVREKSFILAHGIPAQAMTGQQYNAFAEAVAEISGGKMTIDQKVGGTLITDTESLDAVMDGTVDFIHSMGSYVTGTIPNIAPVTIYGYFIGDSDAWFGFADAVRDVMGDIYGEFGVHFVGSLYQGTMVVVCTNKLIKSPVDMDGEFFRTSGTWVSKTVQSWGATPTTIGLADLTTAFERNTVQGTTTGWNIAVPFKLYEVAKNITFTTFNEGYAALLMNGDTWDGLNADEQAVITAAGKVFEQKSVEIALELREGYKKTIEDAGVNTYELSDAEQQKFFEKSMTVFDEVKNEVTGPGLELLDVLESLRG